MSRIFPHHSSINEVPDLIKCGWFPPTDYKLWGEWRIIPFEKRVGGFVRGLPHVCGIPVATNGILILLSRGDEPLFEAHLSNFIPVKEEHIPLVKCYSSPEFELANSSKPLAIRLADKYGL